MNLTNISKTPLHVAFEECLKSATKRGMRVTGSELVGLVPKKVMIEAGQYFLQKQNRSLGISEDEIIHIAIKSLGLDELGPFDPQKKIIEFLLAKNSDKPLIRMPLNKFADLTASESPAPGGGSISAYLGALGASLGAMVANLSAHKRGWDNRWEEFSKHAEKGQKLKEELLNLVDEDTAAFTKIMEAIRLPKTTEEEKKARAKAMKASTKYAIEVPLKVMKTSYACFSFLSDMAKTGNPNSVSDAGVGALCAKAAVHGAFLNVKINCQGLSDEAYVKKVIQEGKKILDRSIKQQDSILKIVDKVIQKS